MSFLHNLQQHDPIARNDPIAKALGNATYKVLRAPTPPAPPGVPNQNDAANAAQQATDQMRMRRGLLSNIYAGAQGTAPVAGKTVLGT